MSLEEREAAMEKARDLFANERDPKTLKTASSEVQPHSAKLALDLWNKAVAIQYERDHRARKERQR